MFVTPVIVAEPPVTVPVKGGSPIEVQVGFPDLVLKLPHLPLKDIFVGSVDLELIRAPRVQKIIQRFEAIFRIGIGDRLSRLIGIDPAQGRSDDIESCSHSIPQAAELDLIVLRDRYQGQGDARQRSGSGLRHGGRGRDIASPASVGRENRCQRERDG